MPKIKILLVLLAGFAVAGCELFEGRGDVSFSIAATNPVSDPDRRFERVVIAVSEVTFVSTEGERERLEFDPAVQIDLLDFTRGDSASLIDVTSLPSASYESVEITIDSEEESSPSFIEYQNSSDIADIYIPEDQQPELTLPIDFEVDDGETTALTLVFELRKSLRRQDSFLYELHPSVRLVRDEEASTISGEVAAALITSDCNPAIYAFTGSTASVDDINTVSVSPASTAEVFGPDNNDAFVYSLEFLDGGPYTLALTCDADDEDPTTNDDLSFVGKTSVTIEDGDATVKDISP